MHLKVSMAIISGEDKPDQFRFARASAMSR